VPEQGIDGLAMGMRDSAKGRFSDESENALKKMSTTGSGSEPEDGEELPLPRKLRC